MCIHEIVAKGGFRAELFEERHFERKFVSGSINGWVAPPKDKLNKIIGYSPEHIEIEWSLSSAKQILQTNMNIQMLNPFVEGNADDPLPLDYLPERGVSTNPFTGKEVENVLHSVMSGYNSFSRTRQYDISLLVLQLDDLMKSDEKKCELIEGQDNTFLAAPPTTTLRREPKKRMKPIHELARHKK